MSFTKIKKYIFDSFGGTKKELIETINGNVFPRDKNIDQAYKRMVQDGYFATRYNEAKEDLLKLTGVSEKQLNKMKDEDVWKMYVDLISSGLKDIVNDYNVSRYRKALYSNKNLQSEIKRRLKTIKK